MVEVQQTTQPPRFHERTGRSIQATIGKGNHILNALMISLSVVMAKGRGVDVSGPTAISSCHKLTHMLTSDLCTN